MYTSAVIDNTQIVIDAKNMYYRDLNALLRTKVSEGATSIKIKNVFGQRYIATNLPSKVDIEVYGTPGNDLGAFMDGPRITVYGNVQDGCGNTMISGEIIVHGRAGDILGMSMRGGSIFIRDDVGYRGAIHMKQYGETKPLLVIGGTAQDFFGEYMAGGTAILLGLTGKPHTARFIGTGMHGGVIYLRGSVSPAQLGAEVAIFEIDEKDFNQIRLAVSKFAEYFGVDERSILESNFIKLIPVTTRPYGRLYTY
jgi:glutamate synthase domain-containing protein 3